MKNSHLTINDFSHRETYLIHGCQVVVWSFGLNSLFEDIRQLIRVKAPNKEQADKAYSYWQREFSKD
jgi:hypothetical protein